MALKAELDSRLERTQLENNNLLGKNSSLEQNLKVLETQRNILLERSNGAETLAKQKEKALRAVEDNVTELQAALEAMHEQNAGVVDEWTGECFWMASSSRLYLSDFLTVSCLL
jgi:predicted nuclease with TOPRIM domain